ncbi:hypothetical protein AHAS_Ahas15G0130300 [Arachis hypogaea]
MIPASKVSLPHQQSETQRPLSCSRYSAIGAVDSTNPKLHPATLSFSSPFLVAPLFLRRLPRQGST